MPAAERDLARWIALLLLAASALVGMAHIAILPPWEGFDETAHWSYIQELADTGHAPRPGLDRLSADIAAYPGPMAYGQTGRTSYAAWRAGGAPPVSGGPTRYAAAGGLNWQAQHPPLYYRLLEPIYRLTRGLGWVDHLMVLRLASFALAWAGLAVGVLGTARLAARDDPWTTPIMAAWPFLFPQFFPEFARLGNDSLCLLEASVAWLMLLRLLRSSEDGVTGGWASAIGLGAVLGLGLLTKAFFLPIGAGAVALLALRWARAGRSAKGLGQLSAVCGLALAIGAAWYLGQAARSGSIVGSDEFARFNRSGGLAALTHLISPASLARNLAVIPATLVWAGTWSLARPHDLLLLPLLAMLGLALWEYARSLRDAALIAWAPVALAAPLLAGLFYHAVIAAAGGAAETPGWYLHILAAPLGYAVARGRRRPLVMGALAAYAAVFALAMWVAQLALFSGCALKGADKHYQFGQGCLLAPRVLASFGHPALGAAYLAAGMALGLSAMVLLVRRKSAAQI